LNKPEKSPSQSVTSPISGLKTVSSSPFKQQQNQSPTNDFTKRPSNTNGKLKINPQFLQTASSTSTSVSQFTNKPRNNVHNTISSTNQSNNNFYNNNSSTNQQFSPPSAPQVMAAPVNSFEASKANFKNPSPPYSQPASQYSQPQQAPVTTYSPPSVYQVPSSEPTYSKPQSFPLKSSSNSQPPAFLKHHNKSDDEDDWNDNSEPVKITPTIAPLATYDELDEQGSPLKMNSGHAAAPYSSVSNYQQSYETYEEETVNSNGYYSQKQQEVQAEEYSLNNDGYQSSGQYQYEQPVQEDSYNNNGYNGQGNHQNLEYADQQDHQSQNQVSQGVSLKAIALYDYQANDSDEISFDPNDIISDIVQVSNIAFEK